MSDSASSSSQILQERFKDWESTGVKIVPVLSQPHDGWTGQSGYVQVKNLRPLAYFNLSPLVSVLSSDYQITALYDYIFRLLFPEPSKFITLSPPLLFSVGRNRWLRFLLIHSAFICFTLWYFCCCCCCYCCSYHCYVSWLSMFVKIFMNILGCGFNLQVWFWVSFVISKLKHGHKIDMLCEYTTFKTDMNPLGVLICTRQDAIVVMFTKLCPELGTDIYCRTVDWCLAFSL